LSYGKDTIPTGFHLAPRKILMEKKLYNILPRNDNESYVPYVGWNVQYFGSLCSCRIFQDLLGGGGIYGTGILLEPVPYNAAF